MDAVRTKQIFLALIFGLAMGVGFIEQDPLRGAAYLSALLTIHAAICVLLIVGWFLADTRIRAYKPSWSLLVLMMVLTVFALPFYLVKSRDRGQRWRAVMWMMAAFVVTMQLYKLGTWLGK